MDVDLTLPITGFLVGVLIGLTGMGGGALMTPFLILVLGTRPVVAVGTDLVYGAVTKIAGAYLHWRQGTVDLRLALRLAAASVPAGLLAVAALRFFPDAADADRAVKQVLGLTLMAAAILLMTRLRGALPLPMPDRWRHALQDRGTYVAGAIVGALVGFTSVGSGSLLVPFLVSVFPLAAARVVGTDVFHAAILVTVTAVAHAQGGTVDWSLAATLLTGSIPGVAVGSWMTTHLPSRAVRAGLAVLLLLTAVNLM